MKINSIAISGIDCVYPSNSDSDKLLKRNKYRLIDTELLQEELNKARCNRAIIRQMDEVQRVILVSALRAIDKAKLVPNRLKVEDVSIITGTDFGDLTIYESFFKSSNPSAFRSSLPSTPGLATSIALGVIAPSMTVMSRFCSSLDAIIESAKLIESCTCQTALVAGFDKLSDTVMYSLNSYCSTENMEDAIPFSNFSKGFFPVETGVCAVVEKIDSAHSRNVYGMQIHSAGKRFGENRDAIFDSMSEAMDVVPKSEIAAIIASANGRIDTDKNEAEAIHKLFGDIPVVVPKAESGETLGAGGLLGLFTAGMCFKDKSLPSLPEALAGKCWFPNIISKPEPLNGKYIIVNSIGTNSISVLVSGDTNQFN